MPRTKKAIGTKFFKEGTQNQLILQNFWGNGKAFTMDDLRMDLDIQSPGARLTELREAGFNVVAKPQHDDEVVGRPANVYTIAKRRAYA